MFRLLVIEDETDSRDMLELLLESGGYAVTAVDSEDAAVRALQVGGYDLVIADFVLQRMSVPACWEYIARIVDVAKPAPVGLLTGWNLRESPELDALAFVLRKPCTRDTLFAQVAATLELPPLSASAADTLRRYFRCIELGGGYEAFRSILTADFVYRLPGEDARFANEVHGVDEFIAFTARTFEQLRDPRFEIVAMRPLPEGALVEYVGSWREHDTTRAMPGAVMFQLAGERIRRAEVRINVDELS